MVWNGEKNNNKLEHCISHFSLAFYFLFFIFFCFLKKCLPQIVYSTRWFFSSLFLLQLKSLPSLPSCIIGWPEMYLRMATSQRTNLHLCLPKIPMKSQWWRFESNARQSLHHIPAQRNINISNIKSKLWSINFNLQTNDVLQFPRLHVGFVLFLDFYF